MQSKRGSEGSDGEMVAGLMGDMLTQLSPVELKFWPATQRCDNDTTLDT